MATPKQAAKELIEHLPDQASWNDIMYELYVKQKIEAGLKAVAEGRTVPHEDIKRRLMEKKQRA
jgi:predicted transcriptional regulator